MASASVLPLIRSAFITRACEALSPGMAEACELPNGWNTALAAIAAMPTTPTGKIRQLERRDNFAKFSLLLFAPSTRRSTYIGELLVCAALHARAVPNFPAGLLRPGVVPSLMDGERRTHRPAPARGVPMPGFSFF